MPRTSKALFDNPANSVRVSLGELGVLLKASSSEAPSELKLL